MKIGYARVSTTEQSEERQVARLKELGAKKIFIDRQSGRSMDRPQLAAMLDFVREQDVVIVTEYSRLARSTRDLLDIVQGLHDRDITVMSDKENFDTSTAQGKLMLTIFAGLAEFERDIMLQRQREGIAIAKAAGKYKGRARAKKPGNWSELKANYFTRKMGISDLAKECKVSRPTIYMWLKEK